MSAEPPGAGGELGEPVEVGRDGASWERVVGDMAVYGTAVVQARWAGWLPVEFDSVRMRARLGVYDWQRTRALANPEARARFVATRLLTRHAAAAVLDVAPEEVDLAYRLGGRPYLRGCPQIEVALTHTGPLAAVALSRRGRVGVDMEPGDRAMSFEGVHRLLCTPRERDAVARLPEARRGRELLRLWTLKEAYTKAMGQGMRMGFADFGFSPDGRELLSRGGTPIAPDEWAFATYEALDGHLLSVARHTAGWEPSADTAARSMLDAGFVDEVLRAMGETDRTDGIA